MLTKDQAVCIRVCDYSETSQIATFFARATGKVGVIAKGSKRPKSPFGGPIEVFSHGGIVFSHSADAKLATLTEFEQQPTFAGLAKNLFAMNCCLLGVELLNDLTKDYDPHPELFDSFFRFLQNSNETQATGHESQAAIILLILFQLSLLKDVGLQPVLNHCVNCKTSIEHRASSIEFYFSSSANGLVCRDCEAAFPDRIKLTGSVAASLADLKLLAETNEKTLNEIEKVLISHFTDILGHPPKMAKYVLKS